MNQIRKRQPGLKLFPKDAAAFRIDVTIIHNWETNVRQPSLEYIPVIVRFLGYNPLPVAADWADQLICSRAVLGLSQKESSFDVVVLMIGSVSLSFT